jgi:hypothetical protein
MNWWCEWFYREEERDNDNINSNDKEEYTVEYDNVLSFSDEKSPHYFIAP